MEYTEASISIAHPTVMHVRARHHWVFPYGSIMIREYTIGGEHSMYKYFISGIVGVTISGLIAIPVLAAPAADPQPDKGNDSGRTFPYTVPGYDSASNNTICADHGAFGYYAHGAIPNLYETPRAADGYQTGINNGTLCGNRQGNL